MKRLENKFIYIQPILKGKIINKPKYIKQEVDEYRDNPCIEALPPIFDDKYVIEALAEYPIPTAKDKELSGNVRYHILKRIKNYYQPSGNHLKIEHNLSYLIRRSYISRNPNSKEYLLRLNIILEIIEEQEHSKEHSTFEVCEKLSSKLRIIPETTRSTAECFSIIGISGMGKSTAIEKLLLMYPQVIMHYKYKGKPLTRTQITWLKIDCPFDGSLKTLCKLFFKSLDDVLLTTNYFKRYGNNTNSAATMMIHMAHLACFHSIGVLVIDEMQHIINPKNTPDDILNFLVTLVNTIGISVIQVGTPKVTNVLEKGLREVRRAEESGSITWERMIQTEEWDFFIENLWECQWLKNFTTLNEELKNAMYDETQGIPAIAISLFILVQAEAIFNDKEEINANLIHHVARNDLRLTKKIIDAIKNNDEKEMLNYEDISIIVEENLNSKIRNAEYRKKAEELSKQKKQKIKNRSGELKEQVVTEIVSMGLFVNLDYTSIESIVERIVNQGLSLENIPKIKQNIIKAAMVEEERLNKKKKKAQSAINKEEIIKQQDLRYLYSKSEKSKIHIYELLNESNYIKDPLKEFYI